MHVCDVCQKEIVEVVPVADRAASDFLLLCGECVDLYQEEHGEDIFRSPVDFGLVNEDRRRVRLRLAA